MNREAVTVSEEYLTVEQARQKLGWTRNMIAKAIKEGILPAQPNPLDARIKLIRRGDIEHVRSLYPRAKPRPKENPVAA